VYCTAFLSLTWINSSDCRTFWRESLHRRHSPSVPPTSAEIYPYIGYQSDSASSTNYLCWHIMHSTRQPYYLADLVDLYRPSRCLWSSNCHLLAVPSYAINLLLLLELFVYLRLIIGILSLCISAHLTVLLLLNPVLNLTYSLQLITSSHSHASASDSIFDIGAI